MTLNNITKGLGILVLAGGMASCSSDYLSLQPETNMVSNEDVAGNESSLGSALYGICSSMYAQYENYYSYRWFNGEPWFSMVYGDVLGQDYVCYFWQSSTSGLLNNWAYVRNQAATSDAIPWTYSYGLISQANNIIDLDSDEIEGETAFRVAQAYTLRAHGYVRILQVFGPRWADSQNGSVLVAPLRLEPAADVISNGTPNMPLSSMSAILDQIYSDIERAQYLYSIAGWYRDYYWEPDEDIANGVLARAALLKEDWQTAYDAALSAASYYPVMSADDYEAGFAFANSEWMWASPDGSTNMWFASFGATYACNGQYPQRWTSIGAGAVSMDLYRQMGDLNDVRANLFFTPDKVPADKQDLFYDGAVCNLTQCNINSSENDLTPYLAQFIYDRWSITGAPNGWDYPYVSYPYVAAGILNPTGMVVQFGAQFKFWGTDTYSSSSFPYMRGSEMLLTAAEAAYHLGDSATAIELLDEINKNRISDFTTTELIDNDVLTTIKWNRRWELWGEGYSWFDLKRWNEPVVRNAWEAGNPDSGNWPQAIANSFDTDEANGWRWIIPRNETQYNDDIPSGGM